MGVAPIAAEIREIQGNKGSSESLHQVQRGREVIDRDVALLLIGAAFRASKAETVAAQL